MPSSPIRGAIRITTGFLVLTTAGAPAGAVTPPAAAWHAAPAAASASFARDPHYHAGKVVFSFRGNLWVIDEDGSNARQLTRTPSRDFKPRWSADGAWIAFSSDRMGNNDVYVMPATGGDALQLTVHSGSDEVEYWTPDGRSIVFSSNRGPYSWESPLYTVPREGGLPVMIPMGPGAAGMFKQDGSMLAFNRISYPDPRRNYRGARTASVWVKDIRQNTYRQLTNTVLEESQNHVHDANPMWGADGWIYFQSERDGTFNIWKIRADGGDPVQVTKHGRGGVRFASISPDGQVIAYANEFDLWVLRVGETEPRRLPLDLGYTIDHNLVEIVAAENTAEFFSPSPDGRFLAVDFRGEVFIVPADSGVGERRRITESAWRQRGALYSPNGRYLAYLSDETRDEEIWVTDLQNGQRRRVTTHPSKKRIHLWSPDSQTLYWSTNNQLYASDLDGGQASELVHHRAGGYTPTQASPDGRWLVLHRSDDYQNVDVYLHDLQANRTHNVTAHPARDADGLLTPDGAKLIFVSNRDNGVAHIFSVALARPSEDPNDPLVKERLARETQRGGGRGGAASDSAGAGASARAPFRLELDTQDISRRAVQLTRGTDAVSSVFLSSDGRTIYYVAGTGQQRAMHAIDLDGTNARKIADGAFQNLVVSGDGRTVFFRENNGISRMPLATRTKAPVRFALSMTVDKREEWRQMFDELYRHWKYSYVEEDMLGYDWDAIRARLEPAVEQIGTTEDFYMLAAEMVFSLRSSHTGVTPPRDSARAGASQTRSPGFELEPDERGLRVTYIYRDGPADRPWQDLEVGEYVLAFDGQPVTRTSNYWKHLTDRLNEYVTVTVAARPDAPAGERRDLRIQTIPSMSNLRYEDWVTRNREFVDSVSGGRIAYFHMRSMNQGTLDRLKNEIDQYFYKQGMIIDVRYNGGGNIDMQLMDVLQRKPYQYTWTRDGSPVWGRRPQQLIFGPQVMMHNHRSGSNAEMVPHAFKHNGLGPTVGTPTAGAVVSASTYALMDGGSTRIPRVRVVSYDPQQPYNFGFNLENYGVPPDIWARNTPEEEIRRFDRELLLATQEALRLLESGKGRWQHVDNGGSR